jgi:DNA-binding NarL/FixJ family response regulator
MWCDDVGMGRTILIVDDHDGFRSWARQILSMEGFDVVGEAADGASAIDAVLALRPEVVLLDVQLPDIEGFEVAERIAGTTRVVLTSSRDALDYGSRIAHSPAVGFLPKADLTGHALEMVLGREANP